jgi:hypothetical protein
MGEPRIITIPDAAGGGTVEASFKADEVPPTFSTWTITAGAGGVCDPSGVVQKQDGQPFDVTITPDAGFAIDVVTVNGNPV